LQHADAPPGSELTRDPFLKQQFIDTAEQWRTMAAYEEKHGR
jgi:hypothetical protein